MQRTGTANYVTGSEFRSILRQLSAKQAEGNIDSDAVSQVIEGKTLRAEQIAFINWRLRDSFERQDAKKELMAVLGQSYAPGTQRTAEAYVLAEQHARIAATDGVIDLGELQAGAHAMIESGLTPEEAENAVLDQFGYYNTMFDDALERGGIGVDDLKRWGLANRPGQERWVHAILEDRTGGGVDGYVDTNFDGRIDAGDTARFNGQQAPIGDRLSSEQIAQAVMQKSIVDAALESVDANRNSLWAFTSGRYRYNEAMMKIDGMHLVLQPDVKASEAMNDMYENPGRYAFECALGGTVLFYRGLQKYLGDEAFDALFDHPYKFQIGKLGDVGPVVRQIREHLPGGEPQIGDRKFFSNPGIGGAWSGENAIYLGDNQQDDSGWYFAHPFGLRTGNEIIEALRNIALNVNGWEQVALDGDNVRMNADIADELAAQVRAGRSTIR